MEVKLSKVLDAINNWFGRNTIQLGVQRSDKQLQLNAPYLCPCYTTRIEVIMKIKIGYYSPAVVINLVTGISGVYGQFAV
ncbi:MAG: DUF4113 domain-containing protein [Pedobacter sp.]|nr:DUF4113 domain-containing protein [Pedobacter sp.]